MEYRKEIDGLRAIAVLPVILFHAGFETFSGGFVGVDVFFVISGYLITSIILREKREGRFTLVGFYERRARRILPTLFVVMLATIPLAYLWMLPDDLKDFSRSVLGVTAFISNILFWRESGYFVTAAELKPLLHTWSLAVEEQYYLLFPLFILITWRFGKRWIVFILVLFACISLGASQWGAINKPIANFYLLPTRGWELLLGGFIAFYEHPSNTLTSQASVREKWWSEYGGVIGLILIVYSTIQYSKTTPFPSVYALVPTLGAACIIIFANSRTIVGKLLGSRPLVFIGLISYSAYLWHQPLFALARHRSVNEPKMEVFILLAFLVLGLAYLSWRYVETPFRNRTKVDREKLLYFGVGGSLVFALAGCHGYLSEGFPSRHPTEWSNFLYPEKTRESVECRLSPLDGMKKIKICYFGDEKAAYAIALYGDSHAQALFSELDKSFKESGIRGVRVYIDDCGVIPGILLDNEYERTGVPSKQCLAAYKELLSFLKKDVQGVIVGIRWTMALFPIPGGIDELGFNNGEGGKEYIEQRKYITIDESGIASHGGEGKRAAIHALLHSIAELNKKVFIVHPVPEVGWNIPKYNFVAQLSDGRMPTVITTSYDVFKARNAFVNESLSGFEVRQNMVHIKPEVMLCDSYVKDRCVAQVGGTPLYYDSNHLSNAGARMVVKEIMSHLQ